MSKIEIQTRQISPDEATRLHRAYEANCAGSSSPPTRAVIFDILPFYSIVKKIGDKKGLLANEVSFVCYFGQYGTIDGPDLAGKNTIIIHFSTIDFAGNCTVITDEIYNFGDLRPPKGVNNEQIHP